MKVVVFGASGGVGREVVRLLVEHGHEVTAFVRRPDAYDTPSGVRVVAGDAFDAEAVRGAITGQDAVVSCLGSTAGMKKSDTIARMTRNVVHGMQAEGVTRIAVCASAGVHGEMTGLFGRFAMWLLRNPLADHRAALEAISAAGLDATVARPAGLKDDAFDPAYVETVPGMPRAARSIPRASVAHFLVKALENPDRYLGTSVGLSSQG